MSWPGWLTRGLLHALCAVPLLGLIAGIFRGDLGANPVETLTHETGEWALRWLLVCLAITPLRQWSGRVGVTRYRRLFGLWMVIDR